MDGVLINSMPVHMQAWEDYLLPFGMRVDNLESRMHGRRNPELVRDLFGEGLPEDVVIEHGAAKERLRSASSCRTRSSRLRVARVRVLPWSENQKPPAPSNTMSFGPRKMQPKSPSA